MGGGHLQLGAQRGDRAAQLVRGVGDEAPLPLHRGLQGGQRPVGGRGEPGDLVVRVRHRDAAREVLAGGDRGHLPADARHGAQRAPGDQPGHPADDGEQQREADQHDGQRGVHGAVFGGERGAGVDGEVVPGPVLHGYGGEAVVLRVAVDRRGTVADGGPLADLAGLQRLAGVVIVVRVAVVVAGGSGGGLRFHRVDTGTADPLQVLAGGDQPAVLVDHLHRTVVHVQRQLGVRRPDGQLGGDFPRGALRLGAGLAEQVGAQGQQDGGAGRDEGDGDHEGGAERGPGPHRPEEPAHRSTSSR